MQMSNRRSIIFGLLLADLFSDGCSQVRDAELKLMGDSHKAWTMRLQAAIADGNIEGVRTALSKGADINGRTLPGITAELTPLMLAAQMGRTDIVKLLLSAGADPNLQVPVSKVTALVMAIDNRHRDAAIALLDGGADPNTELFGGITALNTALTYRDREVVQALLQKGARPSGNQEDQIKRLLQARN